MGHFQKAELSAATPIRKQLMLLADRLDDDDLLLLMDNIHELVRQRVARACHRAEPVSFGDVLFEERRSAPV